MNKLLFAGLLALLAPAQTLAQGAFDGTWKIDVATAKLSDKPDVFALHDGKYDCTSCVPPYSIAADGADQPVSGHPYYDTRAVRVIDERSVEETAKKDGKVVLTSKTTVAADGETAQLELTDSTGDTPVTARATLKRVAAAPAGAHAISGSWITTAYQTMSDNGLTFTLKIDADTVSFSTPAGQSFTAKLDGTDASYRGDPGVSSVSLKKVDRNTLQETDKLDGKVVGVATMVLSADGKSMAISTRDELRGKTNSFTARKQ